MKPARPRTAAGAALAAMLAWASSAAGQAQVQIYNVNQPTVGFNDPTPATPIGGNAGTTVGEQRFNAFRRAAEIWGSMLVSAEPIAIFASFDPLECERDRGVLGAAGPTWMFTDFPGAPLPNTLYPPALANALSGFDHDDSTPEIQAQFNTRVDDPDCLEDRSWYYGLDGASGPDIDLVVVVLHEFGHGLGMIDMVDRDTGQNPSRIPAVYTHLAHDVDAGLALSQMSSAARLAALTNVHGLVWDGQHVTAQATQLMEPGVPQLEAQPPIAELSGLLAEAPFAPLPAAPITAELAMADDGSAPLWDACDVLVAVPGRIVLVQRGGGCETPVKARNAEAAGAAAVLIADDEDYTPPFHPRAFDASESVSIPVFGITRADGEALRVTALGGPVTLTVSLDTSRQAGMRDGRLMLYASSPTIPGSSVSHWDPSARPSLLMEPRAMPGLRHDADVTLAALRDMGWPIAAFCGSGVIDAPELCDDGAANSDERPDACRSSCTPARCGDGVTDTGEECDDGNADPGDGCDPTCASESTPPPPGQGGAAGEPAVPADAGAGAPGAGGEGPAGAPSTPERKRGSDDEGGCGCRASRGSPRTAAAWLGLALLLTGRRRTRWAARVG